MNKIEWNRIFKEALFILLASAFIAVVYNWLNPRGINLLKKPTFASDTLIEKFLTADTSISDTNGTIVFKPVPDTVAYSKQVEKETAANNPTSGNEFASKQATSTKTEGYQLEETSEIPIVTYNQLVKLLNSKKLILIDARSPEDYNKEHIANAINIFAFEEDLNKYFESLTRVPLSNDKIIIVYCEGGTCDASHKVAGDLIKLGYRNVFVYAGGWEEWTRNRKK